MTIYGYASALTLGESLDAQLGALKSAGCERIYKDKIRRKKNRVELKRLLKEISGGDVIVVIRLDRLAQSTLGLLRIVQTIRRAGASFRSLHESWADSTSMHGRVLLTIIAGFAEFERELIVARTAEERAKSQGKKFSRGFKLTEHQRRAVIHRLDAGDSHREIARDFDVSHQTIGRIAQQHLIAAV